MKKASIYAISVCLLSWAVYGGAYLVSGGDIVSDKQLSVILKSVYMFLPMIVALLLQKIGKESFKSSGLLNFRINRTWLVALLLPLVAVLLSIPFSALLPGVELHYGPEQIIEQLALDETTSQILKSKLQGMSSLTFICIQLLNGVIAGLTVNSLFAFGEEYGWRSYMVNALRGASFWKQALFIGFVWGIWHMPLILAGHNYPQHPISGIWMMCVACFLIGTIELYLVLRSGSVFTAVIFHGTFNAIGGLVPFFVKGGNDLTIGITGVGGFLSLALIIAGIYFYDRCFSKECIIK